MKANGIHARHKRRYKATTDSRHALPVAPNLLGREFETSAPDPMDTGDGLHCRSDDFQDVKKLF